MRKLFLMAATMAVAVLVLVAGQTSDVPVPQGRMLVSLELDNGREVATGLTIVPGEPPVMSDIGDTSYRLLGKDGAVLSTGNLRVERTLFHDRELPNGDLTGMAELIEGPISISLPYYEEAQELVLKNTRRGYISHNRLDNIHREFINPRAAAPSDTDSEPADFEAFITDWLNSGAEARMDSRENVEPSADVYPAKKYKIKLTCLLDGMKDKKKKDAQVEITFNYHSSGNKAQSIKVKPFTTTDPLTIKVKKGVFDLVATCTLNGDKVYPYEIRMNNFDSSKRTSLKLEWETNTFVKGKVNFPGIGTKKSRVYIIEQKYADTTKQVAYTLLETNDEGKFSLYLPARFLAFAVQPYDRLDAQPFVTVKEIKQKKNGKMLLTLDGPVPGARGGEAKQKIWGTGADTGKLTWIYLSEAYTDLNEPFTDENGNGRWDGDLLLDENDNYSWDDGERYIDRNGNGVYDTPEPFTDQNGDRLCNRFERAEFELTSAMMTASVFNTPPFNDFADKANVYTYWTPSTHGCESMSEYGSHWQSMQTYYGVSHYRGGTYGDRGKFALYTNISRSDLVSQNATQQVPNHLFWVVLVRDPFDIMVSNSYILQSAYDLRGGMVLVHEMGHNVGGLADEYVYGGDSWAQYPYNYDSSRPNQTSITNPDQVKWKQYFTETPPVPTPDYLDIYGLFEGCAYATGAYRPTNLSMMRSTLYPFFKVNDAALRAILANYQ